MVISWAIPVRIVPSMPTAVSRADFCRGRFAAILTVCVWGFDIDFPAYSSLDRTPVGIPSFAWQTARVLAAQRTQHQFNGRNTAVISRSKLARVLLGKKWQPVEYHLCGLINRLPNADLWHNALSLGTTAAQI